MTKKIRKAVLPVAGFGTRVLPASKAIPKELFPVFDKPVLHYVIEEAFQAGIEHIVLVTGRQKEAIEDYFDHAYELEDTLAKKGKTETLNLLRDTLPPAGSLSFVRQQTISGLGHAIGCAEHIIGQEAFAVLLPDVLIDSVSGCLAQMIALYEKLGTGNFLAVEEVAQNQVDKYGIIAPKEKIISSKRAHSIAISALVEKPCPKEAPSCFAITGRYVLQPEIFSFIRRQNPGAGGEIQLTDAMNQLIRIQDFYACPIPGNSYDCGDKIGYLKAFTHYALKHEVHGEAARKTLASLLSETAS